MDLPMKFTLIWSIFQVGTDDVIVFLGYFAPLISNTYFVIMPVLFAIMFNSKAFVFPD